MFALLLAAAVSPAAMIDLYDGLCTRGATPAMALDRAQRQGWRPLGASGVLQAARDPGGVWTLKAGEQKVVDERFDSCGIETAQAQPELGAALERQLGFAPFFRFATSATFYAVRTERGWIDGAHLNHADFAAAKAAGRFYSLTVTSGQGGASIFSLNIRPPSAS